MGKTVSPAMPAAWSVRALLVVVAAVMALSACKTPQTVTQGSPPENVIHLKKITFMTEKHGTVVRIYGSRKLEYASYKLAEPLRLAVEMQNVVLDFEPKRISVDDAVISAISVVRFPKVNSVRVELELLNDSQFKLSQKQEYLEVLLSGGMLAQSSRKDGSASKTDAQEHAEGAAANERVEALTAELGRVKAENLESKKLAAKLEEESAVLKKQADESRANLDESHKQLEEANSLSKTLQARVAFVERLLSDLESKVGEKKDSGPSPAPSAGIPAIIPAPLPAPSVSLGLSGGGKEAATPSAGAGMTDEVTTAVAAWLKAWNARDLKAYETFYSPDFKAGEMGLKEWMEDKRIKFSGNKSIRVNAKKMKTAINPDGTATVIFEQTYKAGGYRDKGTKQLILSKQNGGWRITSEEWSPR